VWIFLQYVACWVDGSLVGYLAKLAGQILLHGRSQTGLASHCSLCPAVAVVLYVQGFLRQYASEQRRLNIVDMETGVESVPLLVGKI
jgi:hypothetical protein